MLPDLISNLSSLKELSIIHNKIASLPKSISTLQHLKHIYVRGTNINHVPEFLKNSRFDPLTRTIYLDK
ncbi:MAG: hypothetical protein ACFFAA_14160 [Promethearchaeota archaeon]